MRDIKAMDRITVHCPKCGASMRQTAVACAQCGYDFDEKPGRESERNDLQEVNNSSLRILGLIVMLGALSTHVIFFMIPRQFPPVSFLLPLIFLLGVYLRSLGGKAGR